MKVIGSQVTRLNYITKLFYLIEDSNICCGVLLHVYNDKIFIDKVDTSSYSKKYFVSFLLTLALESEASNSKTVYLTSKPSEYLFCDSNRIPMEDQSLIRWWLNFFSNLNVQGDFYIPNEQPTHFMLPPNVNFTVFDRYDFKADGIDDPSKPWDEMTEYIGCFCLKISDLGSSTILCKSLSYSQLNITINEIRKSNFQFPIKNISKNFQQNPTGRFEEFKASRASKAVQPKRKAVNINNLIKKKKRV
eukprot:NODE_330_length_10876_cov_0.359840.p5 type:complete len:247 gc:universal NODE_330_length_10876_cov_0.359840:975-1715(+)